MFWDEKTANRINEINAFIGKEHAKVLRRIELHEKLKTQIVMWCLSQGSTFSIDHLEERIARKKELRAQKRATQIERIKKKAIRDYIKSKMSK